MEKIIINGVLYKCKNGTNNKIAKLLANTELATGIEHEKGIVYVEYNNFLYHIQENCEAIHLDGGYQTF